MITEPCSGTSWMASRPMRSFSSAFSMSGVHHRLVVSRSKGTAPPCTRRSSCRSWRSDRSRRIVSADVEAPGQIGHVDRAAPQREHVDLALAMMLELRRRRHRLCRCHPCCRRSSSVLHRPYRDCERSFSPHRGERADITHALPRGGEGGTEPVVVAHRSREHLPEVEEAGRRRGPPGVPRRVADRVERLLVRRTPARYRAQPASASAAAIGPLSSWNTTVGSRKVGTPSCRRCTGGRSGRGRRCWRSVRAPRRRSRSRVVRDRGAATDRLVDQEVLEEMAHLGERHGLVDVRDAGQRGEVGAMLEWPALSNRSLYSFQSWTRSENSTPTSSSAPAVGELVLDDPLAERLGDDRPAVITPTVEEPRPVGVRGRRSDAIDHRVRERAMTVGPVGE